MTVNYCISKFSEVHFSKEGALQMESVPREGDTVTIKGVDFKVTGKTQWQEVYGFYYPLIFLTD